MSATETILSANDARGAHSLRRLVSCVGTQPPAGYVAWHLWAETHYKAGIRQTRCPQCQLWNFPQEMSAVKHTSSATTTKWGNAKVITTGNICNKCAANNVLCNHPAK